VLPAKVVDEDRHRGEAVERGVWSPEIVEPQPASQGAATFGVAAVQPGVGPLIQQGLVEPLDLAIGLGPVAAGALAPDPQPSRGLGKQHRVGVGLGVVGQDSLDPHPVLGEEPSRLDQEAGAGLGGLDGEDLAEGDPGAVINAE
jgi:hypothetical protein